MGNGWRVAGDVASRLKEFRRALGWTQAQAAEAAGRRVSSFSAWERGVTRPSRSTLERLAEAARMPVTVFQESGPQPTGIVREDIPGKDLRADAISAAESLSQLLELAYRDLRQAEAREATATATIDALRKRLEQLDAGRSSEAPLPPGRAGSGD